MATVQVATRLDENIKQEASRILERDGLDLPTFYKIITTRMVHDGFVSFFEFSRDETAREKLIAETLKILEPKLKNAVKFDPKDPKAFDDWEY